MSNKLEIQISEDTAKSITFTLIGQIDEDSNFDSVKDIERKEIIFDFDKVSMINSCGVREWINLIENLRTSAIIYCKCPQSVVEQVNMVHGFITANTTVESFYAPYYSEEKDEVQKVLIHARDIKDSKAPSINIDGEELEFDAIEAQYFQFLKHKA